MPKMNNNRLSGNAKVEDIDTRLSDYITRNDELKSKVALTDEANDYEKAINYNDLRGISIGLKLYKLSSVALDIIMYLHLNRGFIQGGYSDLTRALGRKDGPNGHVPNITKMCRTLEEQGILIIWRKENSDRPTEIDLNPNWINLI